VFKPKLGVSLGAISSELTDETLQALGSSRIATLELNPAIFGSEDPGRMKTAFRQTLRQTGIRPMSVHARFGGVFDYSTLDESARLHALELAFVSVDLAVEFDAPIVVVHASAEPIEPEERPRRIEQARKTFAELGERCKRADKKVAIEMLPRTCLGHTVDELLELMDDFDADIFGVCLDVNHMMDRYRSLPDVVRRLGPRLTALHLSDYDGVDEKHQLPGSGVIDWAAFMNALRDIDYSGPFNYECGLGDGSPAERIDVLRKNFDWLASL